MELPSKLLEQIAFNTRPKIEDHMLIVMDKSLHEEHLIEGLQTKIKQFKIAVFFYLLITAFSMSQVGIINLISRKISSTKILFKLESLTVLTKWKIYTMKFDELLLIKIIIQKQFIRLQSSQISQL